MRAIGPAMVVGMVAACGHPAARPIGNQATTSTPLLGGAPMAAVLDGPFASIEAYCAHARAASSEARDFVCAQQGEIGALKAPFRRAVVVHVTQPASRAIGCVFLIDRDGWYATPVSNDMCASSGDPEPRRVGSAVLHGAVGIAILVRIHRDPEEEFDSAIDYELTALCGLVADKPACMPLFTSSCNYGAPVGACLAHGYGIDWVIRAGAITFTASPGPDGDHDQAYGPYPLGF